MTEFSLGSLFAGIGGFDLGFERAGFKTAWQVEINPYCQQVLQKRFPHATRHADVRECGSHNLSRVDVMVGGFPCQDISNAGPRTGINGARSGLYREYIRIIGELRPGYAVLENVSALLGRGLSTLLGDLTEIGYDAEWQVISAADVGAKHIRERIWIVSYPTLSGLSDSGKAVVFREGWREEGRVSSFRDWWSSEPELVRVVHGLPHRLDRLKALGNAVVPQIPELIARRLHVLLSAGAQQC